MTYAVVWDLETTGRLSQGSDQWKHQPGICQIAAQRLQYLPAHEAADGVGQWFVDGEFSTFIDPEIDADRWEAGAIEVTGIGPEQVKDAPTLLMAHEEIASWFLGCEYSITYNGAHFDYPVLGHQLRRYNLDQNFPWPIRHIDIMKFAPHWMNDQGKRGLVWPKLGELHERVIGTKLEGAHDALNDVRGLAAIFIAKGGLEGCGL